MNETLDKIIILIAMVKAFCVGLFGTDSAGGY
jgi:hypothetical protein